MGGRAVGGLVKWENEGGKDSVVCINRVDNSVGTYFEGFITFLFLCPGSWKDVCLDVKKEHRKI